MFPIVEDNLNMFLVIFCEKYITWTIFVKITNMIIETAEQSKNLQDRNQEKKREKSECYHPLTITLIYIC